MTAVLHSLLVGPLMSLLGALLVQIIVLQLRLGGAS